MLQYLLDTINNNQLGQAQLEQLSFHDAPVVIQTIALRGQLTELHHKPDRDREPVPANPLPIAPSDPSEFLYLGTNILRKYLRLE